MLRTSIIAIVSLFILAQTAQAEFKIATVDINKIINETSDAKTKRKELDTLAAQAKKTVETKRDALKAVEAKIKGGQIKEDSKEAENFKNDARELARMVRDTEDDLRKKFMKTNQTLTEAALKVVNNYATQNKFDLVLDKSDGIRGPVIFGAPTFDITDDVIHQING